MGVSETTRIGTVFAGYRVESLLGRGGMSVVYLAEHVRLGRKVALKVLASPLAGDEHYRERFIRESQRAADLDHPNVIPIYDAGEIEGGDLHSRRTAVASLGGADPEEEWGRVLEEMRAMDGEARSNGEDQ